MNKEMDPDFRKADPKYTGFVPKTCYGAIDLFNRFRNQGLPISKYPECFIHCARALPDAELDKFHRFIIQPQGDISSGDNRPTQVDKELEAERRALLEEAELRDKMKLLAVKEESYCTDTADMEDEKTPDPDEEMVIIHSAR